MSDPSSKPESVNGSFSLLMCTYGERFSSCGNGRGVVATAVVVFAGVTAAGSG